MMGFLLELFDVLLSVICWIGRFTIVGMIALGLFTVFALPWIVTYGEEISAAMRTLYILYDVLLGCVCVTLFTEG